MQIRVERIVSGSLSTLGVMYIDNVFQCFTLEDPYREEKVMYETRIPAGTYTVGLRTVGGFHGRYQKKFAGIHKGMLQLKNVPDYEYILIHVGNTHEDTGGCLLVGTNPLLKSFNYQVMSSTDAYRKIYSVIANELVNEHTVEITIIDRDRGDTHGRAQKDSGVARQSIQSC